MTAFYNEIDPYAAAWLRNLIGAGHIAPGVVDERDIRDIRPEELNAFTQCHFFAGIGVWSHALRQAGWPDDRPVWTGSCPCQPFSAAGRGAGAADERHLWPHWHYLIDQCRPAIVLGEQVEAAIRHGWLDLVQADLEGSGYACGAVVTTACGFGAPHIRARLYFAARLAHTHDTERRPGKPARDFGNGAASGRDESYRDPWECLHGADWKAFAASFRGDAHGAPARVGRLRAYGNAICAPQATAFVEAVLDYEHDIFA